MTESYRFPRLERAGARVRPLLYLLIPGLAIHELSHYVVGRAVGARAAIDWREMQVRLTWIDAPRWRIRAAHLAPLVTLWLVSIMGAGVVAAGAWPALGLAAEAWLVANWAALLPHPTDVWPRVEVVDDGG